MMRLMESLEYENDPATAQKVTELCNQYVSAIQQLPADRQASKRDEVRSVNDAFKFLARFKIVPADFAPKVQVENLIKEKAWDKKK